MRMFFAPIIPRFKDTDALLEAMDVFARFDHVAVEPRHRKIVDERSRLVAKELVRRNVRFW